MLCNVVTLSQTDFEKEPQAHVRLRNGDTLIIPVTEYSNQHAISNARYNLGKYADASGMDKHTGMIHVYVEGRPLLYGVAIVFDHDLPPADSIEGTSPTVLFKK